MEKQYRSINNPLPNYAEQFSNNVKAMPALVVEQTQVKGASNKALPPKSQTQQTRSLKDTETSVETSTPETTSKEYQNYTPVGFDPQIEAINQMRQRILDKRQKELEKDTEYQKLSKQYANVAGLADVGSALTNLYFTAGGTAKNPGGLTEAAPAMQTTNWQQGAGNYGTYIQRMQKAGDDLAAKRLDDLDAAENDLRAKYTDYANKYYETGTTKTGGDKTKTTTKNSETEAAKIEQARIEERGRNTRSAAYIAADRRKGITSISYQKKDGKTGWLDIPAEKMQDALAKAYQYTSGTENGRKLIEKEQAKHPKMIDPVSGKETGQYSEASLKEINDAVLKNYLLSTKDGSEYAREFGYKDDNENVTYERESGNRTYGTTQPKQVNTPSNESNGFRTVVSHTSRASQQTFKSRAK